MSSKPFRILIVHLDQKRAEVARFSDVNEVIGGSGLAAAIFQEYGLPDEPWNHPDQPLIFAIGPLTGYFPLMSKVVCGFKSPYHDQYAESHAGGRLALAMRFAGFDALVFRGKAPTPSAAVIGSREFKVEDVHWLWGADALTTGKLLRKAFSKQSGGHRSIFRIGPAGERGSAYACINVDTFRHFGRLGSGAVMGAKNLKGVAVQGDANFDLPEGKEYAKLFKQVYEEMTATSMMKKYHDLGTPQNLIPLNELKSLPWRNLQKTTDPEVTGISGETFAEQLLMRNHACSGCPVGCIHVGMLREQFTKEHRFQYRQVGYDYEPIFAVGSMLDVTDASRVLAIMDEVEKEGLDVMSAGVALAWATEAFEKGLVSEEQTVLPLAFGDGDAYRKAIWHLGHASNEFYRNLAQGALHAAKIYGGEDFACVLGQEMAGYATGETYFVSQSMSFRHSHLDTGAYAFDQKHDEQDAKKAIDFLVEDEKGRCLLTSLVSCMFARGVYKDELIAECLKVLGHDELAGNLDAVSRDIQKLRWKMRFATGYDPEKTRIPKRFMEVVTWKGGQDEKYVATLKAMYAAELKKLAE